MSPAEAPQLTFRELYPGDGDADLTRLYAPRPAGPSTGRHVRVNMIASLDGGTSRDGTSGSLGGPADHVVFALLRSYADAVLVGAGTMRAEQYGPARLSDESRRARIERGQTPVPPIAVVTRSANLDWQSAFFVDAEIRPVVLTVEASRQHHPDAAPVADVVIAGSEEVDLALGLDELARRGLRHVLVEGGPSLNADLLARDAIDEVCLSVSPVLLGGSSSRILRGESTPEAFPLELASIVTADGFLFLRYSRRRGDQ
jgi:riboflavin biosynthesis pyrimidine reductase